MSVLATIYAPGKLLVSIVGRNQGDLVVETVKRAGARGGTVLHGKGTGNKDAQRFYHFSIAAEKEVVLIVTAAAQKADIMRAVLRDAGPDSEAGTIVFSLPVSDVAGFGFLNEE